MVSMALPKTENNIEKATDVEILQRELEFSKSLNYITHAMGIIPVR